ncbi:hypothetical protein [Bauldia litoralis]|uniref:hypothetical protein n=1 Tax=Bauldia litoralis TaxID=665467 RepID=UPI00326573BC
MVDKGNPQGIEATMTAIETLECLAALIRKAKRNGWSADRLDQEAAKCASSD